MKNLRSLLLSVVALCAAAAFANPAPKPLRMAYCMEPGVCYNRPGGPRTGVAVDWVTRIGAILGRPVEYVDVTQEKAEEMLLTGEVDLIGGIIYRVERAKKYHYFPHLTGQWKICLYTRAEHCNPRGGGTPLKNCRLIGNVRSFPITEGILAAGRKFGRKFEIREYDSVPEMEDATRRGEIDAFLADGIADGSGLECVACDTVVPQYFVTGGQRWDLIGDVERAMREVASDGNFVRECRERNYPLDGGSLLPNFEELLWLERRIVDSNLVRTDLSLASSMFVTKDPKTGRIRGLLGVLLDELGRITQLPVTVVPELSADEAIARFNRGEADLWFASPSQREVTPELAASNGWTEVFLKIPQFCCRRKLGDEKVDVANERIAVWKGDNWRIEGYAKAGLSERVVFCETREDCLNAVLDGRADCFMCDFHVARILADRLGVSDSITVDRVKQVPYPAGMPVYVSPKSDPEIAAMLRRMFRAFGSDDLINLQLRAESDEWVPTMPVSKVIVWATVVLGAVLLLIVGGVLWSRHRLVIANRELRRATSAKSTFIATMSHEIRTPLNAVIGFAEFLRAKIGTEDNRHEFLDGITHASNALLALINDILDLSKLEAGKDGLRGDSADIVALAGEMKSVFGFRFREKGLKFAITVDEDMPRLALNELRMRQVLFNLIGNAVKFTEKGGVSADVTWHATVRTLRVVVEDTGIGISKTAQEHIFQPFEQDGSVRGGKVYEGTGLGLAIVHKLVETAGGTIAVSSEVGHGTTFTVEIPDVAPSTVPVEEHRSAKLRPAVRLEKLKVVIVDDVKMNLMVLRQHLKIAGVAAENIVEFMNAKVALRELAAYEPTHTLVLTDMWMPEMNGEQFAAAMKADEKLARIPIVAVTADADTTKTFKMDLFTSVVTKPVTGDKIRKLFESLSIV